MSLIAQTISAAERIPLPDLVIRTGIRTLVGRTASRLAQGTIESDELFAAQMARDRARTASRARSPTSARTSDGADEQIVV